jgi:hypothetical protein
VRLAILLLTLVCPLIEGAEPPLQPVTVCEVLQDLSAYDGKMVAVVGRFSSRQTGRWLGEQKCDHKLVTGDQEWPNAFWVAYDPADAPKPPAVLAVDAPLLAQKVRTVKLGNVADKVPFGSSGLRQLGRGVWPRRNPQGSGYDDRVAESGRTASDTESRLPPAWSVTAMPW